jgi:hypothetical protein
MYVYGKSRAGITPGTFERYVKFHQYWNGKIPEELWTWADPVAMWNICRMPDSQMKGAVRAYVAKIREGMEQVKGIYVNGQVVTWDAWRWGKFHTRYLAKLAAAARKGIKLDRRGRIVGGVPTPPPEDISCVISIRVTGTVEKRPTKAASRKLVLAMITNGQIIFD